MKKSQSFLVRAETQKKWELNLRMGCRVVVMVRCLVGFLLLRPDSVDRDWVLNLFGGDERWWYHQSLKPHTVLYRTGFQDTRACLPEPPPRILHQPRASGEASTDIQQLTLTWITHHYILYVCTYSGTYHSLPRYHLIIIINLNSPNTIIISRTCQTLTGQSLPLSLSLVSDLSWYPELTKQGEE